MEYKNFMSILTISKEEFVKRLKSFGWRLGMMIAAAVVAFLIEQLKILDVSPTIVAVLGLILGEISKQINQNLKGLKVLAGKK